MKILIPAATAIVMMAAVSVLAVPPEVVGFDIDQATFHQTANCIAPNVAVSGNGLTMIGYHDTGEPLLMSFAATQLVPTWSSPGEVWPDPVILNAGGSPEVCWTREGFVAAFASGDMLLVYESDLAGNWNTVDYQLMDPGGSVMSIDLWGVPTDAAGPYVFMTVQIWADPPNGPRRVLYAAGGALGWTDLEVVAEEPTMWPHPQITWSLGPAGPWPTIFYVTGEPGLSGLVYTTKDLAGGWSAPVGVPGDGGTGPAPIEGEFDVVTHGALNRNVLGLGPQPTCPCGTIHHLAYHMGTGWSPQEQLTVNHTEMDWPMSPCIKADQAGTVHAVWFQLGSNMYLEPVTKTLEYWVGDEFGWTEVGDFLDGQEGGPLGERVALDVAPVGEAVLAWTRRDTIEGVPQPEQVWIARPKDPSDVRGPGPGSGALDLTAWPNPFNPSVNLTLQVPVAGPARLEVYDLRGRLVARLFDGFLPEGERVVAWDGRDRSDRPAPSGVYFARLETGNGQTVEKLVLTE